MEADSLYISVGSVVAIIVFVVTTTYRVSTIKATHERKIADVKAEHDKNVAIIELEVKELQHQKRALRDKLNLHGNEVAELKTGQQVILAKVSNIESSVDEIKKNVNERIKIVRN